LEKEKHSPEPPQKEINYKGKDLIRCAGKTPMANKMEGCVLQHHLLSKMQIIGHKEKQQALIV